MNKKFATKSQLEMGVCVCIRCDGCWRKLHHHLASVNMGNKFRRKKRGRGGGARNKTSSTTTTTAVAERATTKK